MTKPAESKQAIPSPEDRVRAIREREQKATKGPWEYRSGDDNGFFQPDSELEIGIYAPHNAAFIAHARADIPYLLPLVEELIPFCDSPCGHTSQYAYSEDGGKNIVCLICEREELKGQVVSASPQPKCPRCTDSTLTIGQGDGRFWVTCGRGHAAEVPLDFQIADFAQFFVAAPAAEVRKRKDYHAEYVEAVEAAEKARLELDWVLMENESPKETGWYWTFPRNDDDPLTGTSLPYALRYYMANEDGNNFMNNKPMRGWCAKGPITHWLKIPIPPAALTPESASQAAEEKKRYIAKPNHPPKGGTEVYSHMVWDTKENVAVAYAPVFTAVDYAAQMNEKGFIEP